jgi:hypothetical protein
MKATAYHFHSFDGLHYWNDREDGVVLFEAGWHVQMVKTLS